MYKLNRNSFQARTIEEAADHSSYYKDLTWQGRLRIAIYLNSIAFRLLDKPEPKMDKTIFTFRARN